MFTLLKKSFPRIRIFYQEGPSENSEASQNTHQKVEVPDFVTPIDKIEYIRKKEGEDEKPPKEGPPYPDDCLDNASDASGVLSTGQDSGTRDASSEAKVQVNASDIANPNSSDLFQGPIQEEKNSSYNDGSFGPEIQDTSNDPLQDFDNSKNNFRQAEIEEQNADNAKDFSKGFTSLSPDKGYEDGSMSLSSSEDIASELITLKDGEFSNFRIEGESGIEDILVENRGGKMRFVFPEGEFEVNQNDEKAEEMLALIPELIDTPILRRLISLPNGGFNVFVKKLSLRNQGKDILDPPEEFEKLAYRLLFSLMPRTEDLREPLLEKLNSSPNFGDELGQHPETVEMIRSSFRSLGIMKPSPEKEFNSALLIQAMDNMET